MRNANTGVVADILFFQKRDRAALTEPEWVRLGKTPEGYNIRSGKAKCQYTKKQKCQRGQ